MTNKPSNLCYNVNITKKRNWYKWKLVFILSIYFFWTKISSCFCIKSQLTFLVFRSIILAGRARLLWPVFPLYHRFSNLSIVKIAKNWKNKSPIFVHYANWHQKVNCEYQQICSLLFVYYVNCILLLSMIYYIYKIKGGQNNEQAQDDLLWHGRDYCWPV